MRAFFAPALLASFLLTSWAQASRCPGYELEGARFRFDRFQFPASTISGEAFPRNFDRTLYRGDSLGAKHYGLAQAIRAMTGDLANAIGSHLHSDLRDILTGRSSRGESIYRREYHRLGLDEALTALLSCRGVSPDLAGLYASDLLDKALRHEQTAGRIPEYYLGQRDDHPPAVVYATVYQQIAAQYGGRTLVLRDRGRRSIDVGFWQEASGARGLADHATVDYGEVLLPGYIAPSDIEGLWIRESDGANIGWNWFNVAKDPRLLEGLENPPPIDWAFQKIIEDDRVYILVLDPGRSNCITADGSRYLACTFPDHRNQGKPGVLPDPLPDASRPLTLAGVIALCDSSERCAPTKSLFARYARSNREIPAMIRDQIDGMRLSDHRVTILKTSAAFARSP